MNCWEHEKCGREPGGAKVHEIGVCPTITMKEADGFCGGKNGGRGCAYISNTYSHGIKQGSYQEKLEHFFKCDFYKRAFQFFPFREHAALRRKAYRHWDCSPCRPGEN